MFISCYGSWMTVVCHTSELIPQSNFCLDSKHFSAGLMLDRVYAIKWPLRYRETLKYVLPLKGETPSLSSSLPMLQSSLSCHHSPCHQLSPPSYIYHYNETVWFHCIACRNRKISRIIPFCWLAGLYNIFDSNSLSLFKLKDWWSLSNRNNNLMMSRAGLSSLILEYVFFLKEEKT